MSDQEQANRDRVEDIQKLELIIQELDREIAAIQNSVISDSLRRVTTNFLYIVKSRAESKLQTLRNQNQ